MNHNDIQERAAAAARAFKEVAQHDEVAAQQVLEIAQRLADLVKAANAKPEAYFDLGKAQARLNDAHAFICGKVS
jgi:hypothetical protein